MDKKKLLIVLGSLGFVFTLVLGLSIYVYFNIEPTDPVKPDITVINSNAGVGVAEIKQFESEEEFQNFIATVLDNQDSYDYGFGGREVMFEDTIDLSVPTPDGSDSQFKNESATESIVAEDRFSSTNTQVLSIDEADVVKTNGESLFYSIESYGYYYDDIAFPEEAILDTERTNPEEGTEDTWKIEPGESFPTETTDSGQADSSITFESPPELEIGITPDSYYEPEYQNVTRTYIIDALPAEEIDILSAIEEAGQLYLDGDILIIEKYNEYIAYDISDLSAPKELWDYTLDDNSSVITSRMYNGDLFIISGRYLEVSSPCDYPVLMDGVKPMYEISCTDMYYPDVLLDSPQNVTVLKVDVSDGSVKDTVSFMGSSWNTTVYMSENNIYITYPQDTDSYEVIFDFVSKNEDLFTPSIIDRVEKLDSYEISPNSKVNEVEDLLDEYTRFMDDDELMTFQNNLQNRFDTYIEENIRSFSGTGLVKINSKNLAIEATGKFQGTLLNSFSMDEYNGFLRVATTTSGNWWNRWFQGSSEQANDVIVMDSDLHVVGEIRDLGITESIYSARFIGDMAYVVTFRQIDPFYVIDLSDPTDPEMKGELKIPGYSSYLHPISDNHILGIGEENSRVKISLFDVSDPTNPIEVSKYSVSDYWSEVESNHHAFLLDKKHEVFFIPGGNGGYIFSYEGNKINLVKSLSSFDNVNRAVYIDDYMYIFSNKEITVIDENTWKNITTLDLK